MMDIILHKIFGKKERKNSDFSISRREASSREKKKVFLDVLKKATADQKKILAK